MTIFKIRFAIEGGHVHCRLFAGAAPNQTFAKCGDFVVRKGDEFRDLLKAFSRAEVISDSDEYGIDEACKNA